MEKAAMLKSDKFSLTNTTWTKYWSKLHMCVYSMQKPLMCMHLTLKRSWRSCSLATSRRYYKYMLVCLLVTGCIIHVTHVHLMWTSNSKATEVRGDLCSDDSCHDHKNMKRRGDGKGSFSLSVTNTKINNFKVSLPTLPNYKNPCWLEEIPAGFSYSQTYYGECLYGWRRSANMGQKMTILRHFSHMNKTLETRLKQGENWRLRCFPYFMLIGVAKSGTTNLFAAMAKYIPEFASGGLKELHFWEFKRETKRIEMKDCATKPRPTFAHYLDTFDRAAEKILDVSVGQGRHKEYHPLFTGEGTPTTLTNDYNWKRRPENAGLREPKFTNADYIHGLGPQTKFIVIMREPAERTFSNFRMKLRLQHNRNVKKYTVESFTNLVNEAVADIHRCTQSRPIRSCVYDNTAFNFDHMVFKSLYLVYIQDWLKVFSMDQFLFLTMEEYRAHKLRTLKKVVHFLGAQPLTATAITNIEDEGKQEKRQAPSTDQMSNHTRSILQKLFRSYNHQLADLLGSKAFTWGY